MGILPGMTKYEEVLPQKIFLVLLLPSNICGHIVKQSKLPLQSTLKSLFFKSTLILKYNITNAVMKQSFNSLDQWLLLGNKDGNMQKYVIMC